MVMNDNNNIKNSIVPYENMDISIDDRLLNAIELYSTKLHYIRVGHSGQKRIIQLLYSNGEMTQKKLLHILEIKAGSLSELVSKLEKRQYIIKERDTTDRRKTVIKLTAKGRRFFELMQQDEEHNTRKKEMWFDVLDTDEKKELLRLLAKVLSNI